MASTTRYAELSAASAFSFLHGASQPEELAARAAELELPAVALCDARGLYGAPRFYKACKAAGVRPLVGAELDVDGEPLKLLAMSRDGYRNLCRLLTEGALGRPKGEQSYDWGLLERYGAGLHALTRSPSHLARLRSLFPGRFHAELQRHRLRAQEAENRALLRLGVPVLATNGVRYARPTDKPVYDALCCLRWKTTIDRAGRRLEANRERHLKDGAEMARLFVDLPGALAESAALAERLEFTLDDLGYRFPEFPLPPGHDPDSFLKSLVEERAPVRFIPDSPKARAQIAHELAIIAKLGLAGYFLVLWDIIEFCRREKILVQGRGSAANSAVCFALGITAVDPVRMELLFERFLSEERGEWPDIDLDLPSGGQREKVIQHLYAKYGQRGCAMTANVITYRPKLAMRDVAKVMGYSAERVDKLCKGITSREGGSQAGLLEQARAAGLDPAEGRVRKTLALWKRFLNLPRHLGQHSGGMVLTEGRLDAVVPLEPAAMPGRVVIQWDKDDCADLGLIKVDLLGLGMMAAFEAALPMIERHEGVTVDLAALPQDDPEIYAMLGRADTVGVFQLESRAQMASLVRHLPERFYDIVVQVAIIRPGPITGGMVNPFFARRRGREPVTYPHPCLEPILKRTLGVPLFQEQLLRMAMTAAGFSGGEAEELRRAMGFKRSAERMEAVELRLRAGMTKKGIGSAAQDQISKLITSFALYGFPESHAASFALLAYASAYLKVHHPAAFYASLLNCWPMGFYHPETLVQDAMRWGIPVHPIDVQRSGRLCRWEENGVRLGMRFLKGFAHEAADAVEAHAPFTDTWDLARRAGLSAKELDLLAGGGALAGLGLTRREALWQAAKAGRPAGPLFSEYKDISPSPLPEMDAEDETLADYESSGLTAGVHLLAHRRAHLRELGALSIVELESVPAGSSVKVAGLVIARQRPPTARGFTFITLEDETGLAQGIIPPALFASHRAALTAPVLLLEGPLSKAPGHLSVRATALWPVECEGEVPSHDYH
ncbi:MAG: error-prone DNA polymerase [Elusimicrobia bacterium]|nr:error-prone DNA polymerase [Elusimicrobiota bacterium]